MTTQTLKIQPKIIPLQILKKTYILIQKPLLILKQILKKSNLLIQKPLIYQNKKNLFL